MIDRRTVLKHAAAFSGLGLTAGLPGPAVARALAAVSPRDERTLIVFELTGGNDGLNTVVPYGDDAYYRLRPNIGIKPSELLKLDDYWGLNPGMAKFAKHWHAGDLAVVHGCGHERPSYSHSASIRLCREALPASDNDQRLIHPSANASHRYGVSSHYGMMQFRDLANRIAAGQSPNVAYVHFGGDAFDTHVAQVDRQQLALSYAGEMLDAFLTEMTRIGQAERILVMVISEFGRCAKENAIRGTDHGTANVVLLIGEEVHGGHYGAAPDLNRLDAHDNPVPTVDAGRAFATVTSGWLA